MYIERDVCVYVYVCICVYTYMSLYLYIYIHIYIYVLSLPYINKTKIHRSRWRKRVDDGGGLRRGKNTGCNSNTVRARPVKKKTSELKYFQVSRGGHLTSRHICQLTSRCTCQLTNRHICQLTSRCTCQLTSRHICQLTSRYTCQLTSRHTLSHMPPTCYHTCHFQNYE